MEKSAEICTECQRLRKALDCALDELVRCSQEEGYVTPLDVMRKLEGMLDVDTGRNNPLHYTEEFIIRAMKDVVDSADNTGCTEDLTVVSQKAVDDLERVLGLVRGHNEKVHN